MNKRFLSFIGFKSSIFNTLEVFTSVGRFTLYALSLIFLDVTRTNIFLLELAIHANGKLLSTKEDPNRTSLITD